METIKPLTQKQIERLKELSPLVRNCTSYKYIIGMDGKEELVTSENQIIVFDDELRQRVINEIKE